LATTTALLEGAETNAVNINDAEYKIEANDAEYRIEAG